MIAVDSSAVIAILRRETEADRFLRVIAVADGCPLSSVSMLETSMVLAGRTGDAASWADLDALIARAAMRVVPQDAALAETARGGLSTIWQGPPSGRFKPRRLRILCPGQNEQLAAAVQGE